MLKTLLKVENFARTIYETKLLQIFRACLEEGLMYERISVMIIFSPVVVIGL